MISDFDTGEWSFDTIVPGAIGNTAPHLNLWIVARGINTGLYTRVYFPDHADRHAHDPLLSRLPPAQRKTLVATSIEDRSDAIYRFDIVLQGEAETVFLDI